MRKPVYGIWNNKGADQLACSRSLISAFVVHCVDSAIPNSYPRDRIFNPQFKTIKGSYILFCLFYRHKTAVVYMRAVFYTYVLMYCNV